MDSQHWTALYQIGGAIHCKLYELWRSATVATYLLSEDLVRIDLRIVEGKKRDRYCINLHRDELLSTDPDSLVQGVIDTFKKTLEQSEEALTDAFWKGTSAAYQGRLETANPYPETSALWRHWQWGWQESVVATSWELANK
jgi:hypothetical protein